MKKSLLAHTSHSSCMQGITYTLGSSSLKHTAHTNRLTGSGFSALPLNIKGIACIYAQFAPSFIYFATGGRARLPQTASVKLVDQIGPVQGHVVLQGLQLRRAARVLYAHVLEIRLVRDSRDLASEHGHLAMLLRDVAQELVVCHQSDNLHLREYAQFAPSFIYVPVKAGGRETHECSLQMKHVNVGLRQCEYGKVHLGRHSRTGHCGKRAN